MTLQKKKTTTDAVQILHQRYIKGKARRIKALEKEREKADIASRIYELRSTRGLSQQELAEVVGTTQSVISRLEDAKYGGHSLRMLHKIARALHCRVKVELVPMDSVDIDQHNARATSLG